MARHLPFGGSTFDRTLNCSAWLARSASMPPRPSSVYADEGSLLHECAQEMVDNPDDPILPETFGTATLTDDLKQEKLIPAVDALFKLKEDYGISEFFTEPFVELIPDEAGGSVDFLGWSDDGRTMMVVDYKFGYNPVEAEENAQMLFYALCACVDPRFAAALRHIERVVLVIIQPANGQCEPKVWETTPARLDDFELEAYRAIDAANASDGSDPCAGEWCKYCPASAVCKDQIARAEAALRMGTDDLETLADALDICDELEDWIKDVRARAHEQMEQGAKVPGFKLVMKRAVRKWVSESEVMELIRRKRKIKLTEVVDEKLKTPAQVEKIFQRKGLDPDSLTNYITSQSSGTTLVRAEDKRPEALPLGALNAAAERLL